MLLEDKYPDYYSIRELCRSKVPGFVFEYFDSATGSELSRTVDREGFDKVILRPDILCGEFTPILRTEFLGEVYSYPFGVAPVGMSGLIYPQAENLLLEHSKLACIPYTLSTVATASLEDVRASSSSIGWFQLYCPRDKTILEDLLRRAESAGYATLVVTVDLPSASVRERQLRAGLTLPPKLTPRVLSESLCRPFWAFKMLMNGPLSMGTLDKYSRSRSLSSTNHIGYQMRVNPDLEYIEYVRRLWSGKLIVKGVTTKKHVDSMQRLGIDAFWVSNHAGRQFQSGQASIEVLKEVREHTDIPLVFDSGVTSGLDIIKAYREGADFVMLGKAWHFALGAFGKKGPTVMNRVLERDLIANMYQLGIKSLKELNNGY